jgi:hydrophobic/amphiphilic exporter-1 (mainly G- bacteria), HAE1 family
MKITVPNSSRQVGTGRYCRLVEIEDYPVKSLKRLNGKPALTMISL